MKKFLIIFILIFTFFNFSYPSFVHAATPTPVPSEESEDTEVVLSLWDRIVLFFASFRNLFAKQYTIDTNRSTVVTEYSNDPNVAGDASTRVLSEDSRDQMKLQYLQEVIDGKYKNIFLAKCTIDVYILDLANYKLKNTITNESDKTCFEKLYIELYAIPQDTDRKTGDSIQLNKTVRTVLPADSQGPMPVLNIGVSADTAKQTNLMYQNMIPAESLPKNQKKWAKTFAKFLTPQNEQ